MKKKWRIVERRLPDGDAGLCDYERRRISIDPEQQTSERDRLDTIVHELTHAAQPRLTEKQVAKVARFVTKHLWRQGYRRVIIDRPEIPDPSSDEAEPE